MKSTLTLALSEHKLDQLDIDQDDNESLKMADRMEANQEQRSDRFDQENHGGLLNALEKRDQIK